MSNKAFAVTKEEMATGGLCDATGGAQVAQVYQIPPNNKVGDKTARGPSGRNLEAEDAARIVARVSLGKKSILFRLGNDPKERAGAIDELSSILKRARMKGKSQVVPFPMNICRCIAAAALDELTIDMCPSCLGAGQVRDHDLALEGRQPMKICPTCMGARRRQYNEDERITRLAQAWIGVFPGQPLDDPGAVSVVASSLRKHARLGELMSSINFAKGVLIEAERIAVDETGRMAERW